MPDIEVAEVFGAQWPRLVARLRANLGDLDLADDAAQHAFVVAVERWAVDGAPDNPGGWLYTVARRWAIDQIRHRARSAQKADIVHQFQSRPQVERGVLNDDYLAMIFGCCHRSLDEAARIALTLRYVVGLATADIARAFLVPEATMAKRLTRAKRKIAAANIPFAVPDGDRLTELLGEVLRVIYLIYTQGHAAPSGPLVRGDLCEEARWLAGYVCNLLPQQPEPRGLAALLAFTDARRPARLDAKGNVVLLADQDRALWDRKLIAEGDRYLREALACRRIGTYQLQAAIAGCHSLARTAADTDWDTIRRLYAALARIEPSPIVRLNEAIATSEAEGPSAGLSLLAPLGEELAEYHYFHAAHAELLAKTGEVTAARTAYERALSLCTSEPERGAIRRSAAQHPELGDLLSG